MTDQQVEIRGRWKRLGGGKVVAVYIDVKQLYDDAKVAEVLCVGGAVKYALKAGVVDTISDEWLFSNVIPCIRKQYVRDTKLCRVLALPLLYACLLDDILVPENIHNRVRSEYSKLGLEEEMPVGKILLHVYRINDHLMIDEAVDIQGMIRPGGAQEQGGGTAAGPAIYDLIQTIQIHLSRIDQTILQNHVSQTANLSEIRGAMVRGFRTMNSNIRSFGGTIEGAMLIQQQRATNNTTTNNMTNNANNNADDDHHLEQEQRHQPEQFGYAEDNQIDHTTAVLSKGPKTLEALWREYKHGLDGRKPAEQFTKAERNQNKKTKQAFYRRKVFWDVVE